MRCDGWTYGTSARRTRAASVSVPALSPSSSPAGAAGERARRGTPANGFRNTMRSGGGRRQASSPARVHLRPFTAVRREAYGRVAAERSGLVSPLPVALALLKLPRLVRRDPGCSRGTRSHGPERRSRVGRRRVQTHGSAADDGRAAGWEGEEEGRRVSRLALKSGCTALCVLLVQLDVIVLLLRSDPLAGPCRCERVSWRPPPPLPPPLHSLLHAHPHTALSQPCSPRKRLSRQRATRQKSSSVAPASAPTTVSLVFRQTRQTHSRRAPRASLTVRIDSRQVLNYLIEQNRPYGASPSLLLLLPTSRTLASRPADLVAHSQPTSLQTSRTASRSPRRKRRSRACSRRARSAARRLARRRCTVHSRCVSRRLAHH